MKKTRARKKATRRAAFIRAVAREVVKQLEAVQYTTSVTNVQPADAYDSVRRVLLMQGHYASEPDQATVPWHLRRAN